MASKKKKENAPEGDQKTSEENKASTEQKKSNATDDENDQKVQIDQPELKTAPDPVTPQKSGPPGTDKPSIKDKPDQQATADEKLPAFALKTLLCLGQFLKRTAVHLYRLIEKAVHCILGKIKPAAGAIGCLLRKAGQCFFGCIKKMMQPLCGWIQKKFARAAAYLKRRWFLLWNAIYHYLYFIGVALLRSIYARRRRFKHWWKRFAQQHRERHERRKRNFRISMHMGWQDFTAPIRELKTEYAELHNDLVNEKRYGTPRSVHLTYLKLILFVCKRVWQVFRFLFNYIAPVAACAFLVVAAMNYASKEYVLHLTYNGQDMGYIRNDSVFTQAQSEMRSRIINEDYYTPPVDMTPRYQLVELQDEHLLSVDELANILIQSSGGELQEADGLYLETVRGGKTQMALVGAVEDGAELLSYLNSMLEKYRTPDMDGDTKIEFVKKIQMKRGLYPVGSVRSLGEIKATLSEEEKGEQRYTVVEGDTPLRIAAKNGITFDELKLLNPEVDVTLHPGDSLLISQSVPKMGVKVTTTLSHFEEIDYPIVQETVPSKDIGWTNVKQKGREGRLSIKENIVMIDGIEVEREISERKVTRQPVQEIIQVGGNRPLPVIPKDSSGKMPDGAFRWPTAGGAITTGYGAYQGHTGSDITFSGIYGTPVYASAAGTVVVAKYSAYGYGYHIIIDHGGGLQTLYAHCSKLYVNVGDQVEQGQNIAAVGRTGNATGPHLHFEIRTGGTPVNAAPYLYGQR